MCGGDLSKLGSGSWISECVVWRERCRMSLSLFDAEWLSFVDLPVVGDPSVDQMGRPRGHHTFILLIRAARVFSRQHLLPSLGR
jgi:hypothetical protein